MRHWTEAQQWRELGSHEIITARELLKRYDSYLHKHNMILMLVDAPRDRGLSMDDNTTWYRWNNKD